MTVTIQPACVRDVTWIASNMREDDRREIGCMLPEGTALSHAAVAMLYGSGEHAFVAYLKGEPVAAVGVSRLSPWLGSAWAFGTDRTRRVIPALTRWVVTEWKPRMIADGFTRVEVRTIIDHDLSHRWLESLGFEREGLCRGYGRNSEDFVQYAYVR